jgi:hypothetical protein
VREIEAATTEAAPPTNAAGESNVAGAEINVMADLPAGARWIIAPLLPGLALMVREDTSSVVRRIAREIAEQYGATANDAPARASG